MARQLPAFLPALALAALLARTAAGYVLPNGNVVWDLSAGDYDVRIEQLHDSELGSMSITNRATRETEIGDLNPGFVYDRDAALGLADEGFARGLFGPALSVVVELLDLDGVAFDGATHEEKYPAAFLVASPPPLALFESATLTFSPLVGEPLTIPIDRLPEPGAALLLLPLLGYVAGAQLLHHVAQVGVERFPVEGPRPARAPR